MRSKKLLLYLFFLLFFISCKTEKQSKIPVSSVRGNYIEVSPDNPSYFRYSDGRTYIPVGINMINPSGRYKDPDSCLMEIDQWMKNLSDNGGNYVRIWLSQSFWDIEDEKAGQYSEEKAKRIDSFIEMARKYNLKIKMTLEHFRSLTMDENPQSWAVKSVYHTLKGGPLDSIRQYLTSAEGKKLFLDKVDFYKNRYGSDTIFFGWELWNEMNAMNGPQDEIFFKWNEEMLKEVKKRFPENLVMQSLGSFDSESVRDIYKRMMLMPGNEVAQIHRYLDLGAHMDVCYMPMDLISSSAIDDLTSFNTGKPLMLAETGAVEPSHSGPSRLYAVDTAGILLHDILFAPFFSGSAGTGMSWHWDSYVDRNNLWYHFDRFSEAIKGIDPVKEKFVPYTSSTNVMRVYLLNGANTILIWFRDKGNSWQTELAGHQPPLTISGSLLDLKMLGIEGLEGPVSVYDPWKNIWKDIMPENGKVKLPDFKRSIVVRIRK